MKSQRRPNPPAPNWKPCPAGEIERLGQRLRHRKQRRKFLQAASALAGIAVAGGGLWWWRSTRTPQEYNFAGISCSEVREIIMGNRMPTLSPERRGQLQQHVMQCPTCRPLAESMGMTM